MKEIILKRFFIFILIPILFLSCVTKRKTNIETTTTTTVQKEIIKIDEKNILEVFNKLVLSIKKRDLEGIGSCYTKEASFLYDDTTKKFSCYNNQKQVIGNAEIIEQYKFMFKNRILDNIEFEVYKIDTDIERPMIKFINAWQNSDYDFEEKIFFIKEEGKYKINFHIIGKKS